VTAPMLNTFRDTTALVIGIQRQRTVFRIWLPIAHREIPPPLLRWTINPGYNGREKAHPVRYGVTRIARSRVAHLPTARNISRFTSRLLFPFTHQFRPLVYRDHPDRPLFIIHIVQIRGYISIKYFFNSSGASRAKR